VESQEKLIFVNDFETKSFDHDTMEVPGQVQTVSLHQAANTDQEILNIKTRQIYL
jgi:hypothetical protein